MRTKDHGHCMLLKKYVFCLFYLLVQQEDSSYVCQLCISKAVFLSLINFRTEYKGKIPDVLDSCRNIGTLSNSKLKLSKLKDLFVKNIDKLLMDK